MNIRNALLGTATLALAACAFAASGGNASTTDCAACLGAGGAGAACIPATPPTTNKAKLECITCVQDKCGNDCATVEKYAAGCGM